MLFKSLAVLAAAAAATVSAQLPDHTFFTSPISPDITYEAGTTQTFFWQHSCKSGESTSKNPAKTELHLVNADNLDSILYVATVATFDCSNEKGGAQWVVPANRGDGHNYALKINLLPKGAYSIVFKIIPAANSTSTSSTLPTSRTTPTNTMPVPTTTTTTTAPANSSGTPPAGGKSAASSLVPVLSGAAALAVSAVSAMFL